MRAISTSTTAVELKIQDGMRFFAVVPDEQFDLIAYETPKAKVGIKSFSEMSTDTAVTSAQR